MTTGKASANGVTLAYETFGAPHDPPILLIMGLGAQMILWQEAFCEALAERGYFVIRFDNRDIGESTHLEGAGTPDLRAAMNGDASSAPYRLEDMADDAAGLLAALGLDSAHIVGASMGGMIAQVVAVRHPALTRSLTSIMSNTGDPATSTATDEARAVLLRRPARTRQEYVEAAVAGARVIGSPGFDHDEDGTRSRAALAFDRGYDPQGVARQLAAIYATGNRTALLRSVRAPALVIHGADDPLVQLQGGEATAAAIAGAELLVIPGMGHDLPAAAWEQITDAISAVARRGEAARG